jgi:hypothetical protein
MNFEIKRWDAVISGENSIPKPLIYIEPTLEFLDFVKRSNNFIKVRIANTGSDYDDKEYFAIVDKSAFLPSCRPNFYNKTGWYTLTLRSFWNGYPQSNGIVTILEY